MVNGRVPISLMIMMRAFPRLADEHCGQHGENKGLDKRYQYFDKINEYRKSNGYR